MSEFWGSKSGRYPEEGCFRAEQMLWDMLAYFGINMKPMHLLWSGHWGVRVISSRVPKEAGCQISGTLLLSHFSRVRLCVTPETVAHQAPPSLGFSRQEHWSGLPFPSPMHENEKWKWSCSVVSDSSRPHGLQPARLLCPWDFPGKSTRVGCHCLLRVETYMSSKGLWLLFWVTKGVNGGFWANKCIWKMFF